MDVNKGKARLITLVDKYQLKHTPPNPKSFWLALRQYFLEPIYNELKEADRLYISCNPLINNKEISISFRREIERFEGPTHLGTSVSIASLIFQNPAHFKPCELHVMSSQDRSDVRKMLTRFENTECFKFLLSTIPIRFELQFEGIQ